MKSIDKIMEHFLSTDFFCHTKEQLALLEKIESYGYASLNQEELKKRALDWKKNFVLGEEGLYHSFALGREACKRVLHITPYPEQIMTAKYLQEEKIVELPTGSGKTLSGVFVAYYRVLSGEKVHVLTYNDYLAKRDANWMGPLYEFLGVSVDFLSEKDSEELRREKYQNEVLYLTAKEAGFDYLKDCLCFSEEEKRQNKLQFAIVDEADSLMIDSARIPLIVADEEGIQHQNDDRIHELIKTLEKADLEEHREGQISLTPSGIEKIERALEIENLYEENYSHLLLEIQCSLEAQYLLERDVDYCIIEEEIKMIDPFTGRIAEKRKWPDELHRAICKKENIQVTPYGRILQSLPFQYFFKEYQGICGMTGTAWDAQSEFWQVYQKQVVVMESHFEDRCNYLEDCIFKTREEKEQAILEKILELHNKRIPILVGTESVRASEELAKELKRRNISCQVLNAKNDEKEAERIAKAGAPSQITISTNMAGRGVDIRLGGEKEEQKLETLGLGGLFVLGTSRQENRRLDRQLEGRTARQGEPGSCQFFVSAEDDLFLKIEKRLKDQILKSQYGTREIRILQRMVEGANEDARFQLLEYGFLLEEQRKQMEGEKEKIRKNGFSGDKVKNKNLLAYQEILKHHGQNWLTEYEKILYLDTIKECQAVYLEEIEEIRRHVHLHVIGGESPLEVFRKQCVDCFSQFWEEVEKSVALRLAENPDAIWKEIKEKQRRQGTQLRTYFIEDSSTQFSNLAKMIQNYSTKISGTLFHFGTWWEALRKRVFKK